MAEIICIGQACADTLVRGADLGVPFTEEYKYCDALALAVGGDAANESIVMAHMGNHVKIITGLGDDNIGIFVENILSSANVDTSSIRHTENTITQMTVVVVQPDGQRNFIQARGELKSVAFDPVPEDIQGAKIVSFASLFLAPLLNAEAVSHVAKTAKENGALICADVIYKPEGGTLEDIKDILKYIDFIFPNREEAAQLTGENDLDRIADRFLAYGVKNVIIKIGRDGCFVKNASESFYSPSIGPKAIDTTGAGDNFAAGFITALNEGKSLRECCIMAAATAGLACQFLGANTGVKNRTQVEEFLKTYYPKNI